MNFSSWLKDNYPESSKNSVETYQLIRKAKKSTRPLTFAAIVLVYLPTYYFASMLSSFFGYELTKGNFGLAIFVVAFLFASIIFSLINKILIKNELAKLLRI